MKQSVPLSLIRREVRTVLNMRPGFGKTEAQLLEFSNALIGGGISLQELRDALEWNLSERFIRSERDDEANETLWFITQSGIAQQNIR